MLTNILAFTTDAQYTCGDGSFAFEGMFPNIVSTIVTIIKIGIPIILIILGMIDLGKSVMAQKDDEIKKGQQTFVKRLIAAILVFFVVFAVQIVFRFVASKDSDNITSCINCFISGKNGATKDANNGGCWLK